MRSPRPCAGWSATARPPTRSGCRRARPSRRRRPSRAMRSACSAICRAGARTSLSPSTVRGRWHSGRSRAQRSCTPARLSAASARAIGTERDLRATRSGRADVALFHAPAPPPSGGGHQFLRALSGELERRGLLVEENRISGGTDRCLFNSFNFDLARLRRFARDDVRMVHRVDGPIGVYRGFDDGTDARIAAMNAELARRDRAPVALQPRRAPAARHRARRARRDRERPRSGDLPPARRHESQLDGRPRAGRRGELVGQPPQGGRRRCVPSASAVDPGPFRADVRRSPARRARRLAARRRPASERARRAPSSAGLLRRAEPRRPVLERARSRPSPAACRRSSGGAAATPSSSARRASASTAPEDAPAALDRLAAELDECRERRSSSPRWPTSPTAYLEVLAG